ncbi:D-aspartate oxidase [Wolfiporia cocos MD-104 SS10]|uniref:D-aspartate oxidase n=1 Tax=Wolfiporia cocos (strain MD-104) TaxID=742152 RepID=A0A2H3JRE2_WOLCO|nr:D-aspartate oxidase [Wolfiporia cocos MD-104 SS10]
MSTPAPAKNVVVIGAGVIGLTTALTILEKGGYNVCVVAETLPSDPKSVKYTSPWAGAYHVIYGGQDERERKVQRDTFKVMWELSTPGGGAEGCFRRLTTLEYYYDGMTASGAEWMPNFCVLPEDALAPGTKTGYSFDTYTIDPPLYLNYLLSRFIARGGTVVRGAVQHINQVIEGGALVFSRGIAEATPIDALVACPGLGARTLGGIDDKNVYPARGQVVLLNAPWIKTAMRASDYAGTVWTYVIPRRNGTVALGGTKVANDWYPAARPETTDDILRRCLSLCPELAPPEIRSQRAATLEDLRPLILEVGCGLRPARNGGIRLDVEWVDRGKGGGNIPLILNYGHGGSGYESSWGSASVALELLERALEKSL